MSKMGKKAVREKRSRKCFCTACAITSMCTYNVRVFSSTQNDINVLNFIGKRKKRQDPGLQI
jgi:hypothetical protein